MCPVTANRMAHKLSMREPRLRHAAQDGVEVFRQQARAADQHPADLGQPEHLTGILRRDRAAVEDADSGTRRSGERRQARPDVPVHLDDVARSGHLAAADRPKRFIGDHYRTRARKIGREAAGNLVADHELRVAVPALRSGLAYADDRR